MRCVRFAAAVLHCALLFACSDKQDPNILIAISDDQSWLHTSASGDPVVATPTFDRIANEGVLFTHAYSPAPNCSPSRAAIFTGKQIWQLGAAANLRGPLDVSYTVFPDLLEEAGYHVGFTGKGWDPGDLKDTGRSRNPAGNEYNRNGTGRYVENFVAFLNEREEGQPFYFWFGSHDPHAPYAGGTGSRAGLDPRDVPLPPHIPDTPRVRGRMLDYYAEVQRFDRHVEEMLDILRDKGLLDNTIIIVTSDNGIDFPRGKLNLYDYGSRVPLAIRWPGKTKGGHIAEEFVSLMDLAPTLLEAAGVPVPPDMSGKSLVSVIEAGQDGEIDPAFNHVIYGRERHSPYREKMYSYPSRALRTEDYLYIRNFAPDRWPAGDPPYYGDSGGRGLFLKIIFQNMNEHAQTLFYQLNYAKRPAEELYDLRLDPDQIVNVAERAVHATVKDRLWAQLEAHLVETGDPRVRGEDGGWDTMEWKGRINRKMSSMFTLPAADSTSHDPPRRELHLRGRRGSEPAPKTTP